MRRALVWFRSDLRTEDHPALHLASREAPGGVEGVFLLSPGQWREHDWGDPKTDFLLRSLRSLAGSLVRLGIPLHLVRADRFADAPEALVRLARRLEADLVVCHRELEVNERRRDRRVGDALAADGRRLVSLHDQTIVPPDEIQTRQGTFYTVFTPFRRAWMERVEAGGIGDPLPAPEAREPLSVETEAVPHSVAGFARPPAGLVKLWPAGEAEAHRRLERFLESHAGGYGENRDIPSVEGTSALSPYLALGVVSARTCLAAAAATNRGRLRGGDEGLETWITELVWREFYRHVLVGYPRVSKGRPFKEETEAVAWRDEEEDLARWREGRTGVPFVDAGLRQLAATGWMHNRLRMVTAQFLTKDLLLDWRFGERHFMRHLVDGDLASNNGGWQWSASTGTDAAPYFRIFNPWTQGKRFDPDGTFIRRWVPELREAPTKALHDADKLTAPGLAELGYPRPMVDHGMARERCLEAFRHARGGG